MRDIFYFALLAIVPLYAERLPGSSQKVEVPDSGVMVPMGSMGGRPLVDVRINGQGPYRFILDTGADYTVVGDDLIKELGIPSETGTTPPAHGGPEELATLADLRVGDAAITGLVVGVEPLSRMFRGSDAPRGVLSAASFPGFLMILDYPGKQISIRKGELGAADSRTIFAYTAAQILPNVPVKVGANEIRAHIDSGSPGSLTLPTKYLKEVGLASEPAIVGRARTPQGEFPISTAKFEGSIELGQYKLDLTEIQFSDVNPIPGPPTGNIGYRVLQRFVVTLDSKNRRIRLEQ